MLISSFGFKDFRNLEENRLDTASKAIVFTGVNGSGKTSLLECIYSAMLLSSFRTGKLEEVINFQKTQSRLSLCIDSGEHKNIETFIQKNTKKIFVDEKAVHRRAELVEMFAIVAFSYDDKDIVTHEPKLRRHFIDQLLCFTDTEYYNNLKSYKNIIKERNQAIRTSHMNLVSFYDDKLSKLGFYIYKKRLAAASLVQDVVNKINLELFSDSESYSVFYKSACSRIDSESGYLDMLRQNIDSDIASASTTFGVHTDDFVLQKDGKIAALTLSTGQIRLLSILLRLAEVDIVYSQKKKSPVILVDDVLLELDDEKKNTVFSYLYSKYPQVFWTFIEGVDFYKKFDDVKIYSISSGKVKSV